MAAPHLLGLIMDHHHRPKKHIVLVRLICPIFGLMVIGPGAMVVGFGSTDTGWNRDRIMNGFRVTMKDMATGKCGFLVTGEGYVKNGSLEKSNSALLFS